MSACTLARPAGSNPWTLAFTYGPWPILLVVAGFIAWWPLGIAALVLLKVAALAGWLGWHRQGKAQARLARWVAPAGSGNSAFDEHRARVLAELDAQQRDFSGFVEELKRAKDREEFDRFMARRQPPQG